MVGIDDLSVYVPRLFLPLAGEFSASRGIDPAKLLRGIGIERMAVPDAHEDAATMAAMSLQDLMKRSGLQPEEIGKIYVGTESAVDEAKAMGTYVIGMLE
jgi:hydroxymethylglutaryl-CoA synthase